jgi:pimeloyl-ACP methyl ester carboxylesterase
MLRFVHGPDGTRLAVREAGDPQAPPIVLVHGWASAGQVWVNQLADPALTARHRLLAVDLRGHGESDKPADGYADPATWAGDLAAVLDLVGAPAVLVGWSYGGLVVTDYLRERGAAGVAGLVLVGAVTEIGRDRPGGALGPAWDGVLRSMLSDDVTVAAPALTTLATEMTATPRSGRDVQHSLGDMLRVPPVVRKALFKRDQGGMAAVSVPTLVLHGELDRVINPTAAEYAAGKIPGASVRWFPRTGHMPFVERVAEFNEALLEFAGSVAAT